MLTLTRACTHTPTRNHVLRCACSLGFFVYYPAQPSFPLCLGVNVRDNPGGASSFAACGTAPSPYRYSCGCDERECSGYYAVNCTEKRFLDYTNQNNPWAAQIRAEYNTTQALMEYARSQCAYYEVCTVRNRPDVMTVINSRDGTNLNSAGFRGLGALSQTCDLSDMASIMSLISVLQTAGAACEGNDADHIADCDQQTCQDAILEATSHPCLIVSPVCLFPYISIPFGNSCSLYTRALPPRLTLHSACHLLLRRHVYYMCQYINRMLAPTRCSVLCGHICLI